MYLCKEIQSMEQRDGAFLFHTNCADIKVCFVTDEIVRVRVSFDKELAEESYVLSTTAWEDRLDGLFPRERTRLEPVQPQVTETAGGYTFQTAAVRLEVDRSPLCFKLYDKEGDLLYSDLAGTPYTLDSNRRVTHYSAMNEDDCYYGFGEKAGLLNKNKTFLRERATDAMGYDAEKMDTLYKHIPFYIQLSRSTHKAAACSTTTSTSLSSTWAARRATTGPATPTGRLTAATSTCSCWQAAASPKWWTTTPC